MKKILILLIITIFSTLSFSYEDYYKKVYTIKISKTELFKTLNVTEKQANSLSNIFKYFQKKANKIENKFISFEQKKEKLNKIEKERYEQIKKILTSEQLIKFNEYTNKQKLDFEEKNNKIKTLIDDLNLTNSQKAYIQKFDRTFKRKLTQMNTEFLSSSEFLDKFNTLKENINSQINDILTDEQKQILQSFNY